MVAEEMNSDTLNLIAFSQNILCRIIDKLDYKTFAIFEETSRITRDLCNSKKFSPYLEVKIVRVYNKSIKVVHPDEWWCHVPCRRISLHVPAGLGVGIHTKWLEIEHPISTNRLEAITKIIKKCSLTANWVQFSEPVRFSPGAFNSFLENVKANMLEIKEFLPRNFFDYPAINKVENIELFSTNINDNVLLNMKQSYIFVNTEAVTDRGLNKYLLQCQRGERNVRTLIMHSRDPFPTRNFESILEGVNVSVVWTPDWHEYSLIRQLPLDQLEMMLNGDPPHFYILWRSGEPSIQWILRLSNRSFVIKQMKYDEFWWLRRHLSDEERYAVTKICDRCKKQFCRHRRQYSIQRFKSTFPKLHSSILLLMKITATILEIAKFTEVLTCTSCPASTEQYNNDVLTADYNRNWLTYFKLALFK